MKRFIMLTTIMIVVVALLITMSLIGCKATPTAETTAAETTAAETTTAETTAAETTAAETTAIQKEFTIGYIPMGFGNPHFEHEKNGVLKAIEEETDIVINYVEVDGQWDPVKESEAMETLVAQNVDIGSTPIAIATGIALFLGS